MCIKGVDNIRILAVTIASGASVACVVLIATTVVLSILGNTGSSWALIISGASIATAGWGIAGIIWFRAERLKSVDEKAKKLARANVAK